MSTKRLSLALERLEASDWARFEKFASEFLTADFPSLRTVAAPQGDEGRDAELFSLGNDPSVVLQYSVTKYWELKIRATAEKINKNLKASQVLVYVTNQEIGANGDDIKRELKKKYKLYLDIRDKGYFVDRARANTVTDRAAEALARDIVDPFLAEKGVIESKGAALSTAESRAAFVFLALQWEDDNRDKGLTRVAFEALVRSALRNTSAESRLGRAELLKAVHAMVPGADPAELNRHCEQAIHRLTRKQIRHYAQADEFCLTHEETVAIREKLASLELQDAAFVRAIGEEVRAQLEVRGKVASIVAEPVVARVRRVLERFFLDRGELFASALQAGQKRVLGSQDIRTLTINDVSRSPIEVKADAPIVTEVVIAAVEALIIGSREETQAYLRWLSDSYTLFAFLRVAPDVQSAVKKMFSHGELWLDTSMLLPLFGEEMQEEQDRRFTRMIAAARTAGLKFRVTTGVIEEAERHMNRSYACAMSNAGQWRGSQPFLFQFYILQGGARASIGSWLERFRGKDRPMDDVAQYLLEEFGIERQDLTSEVETAATDFRISVKEIWIQIHEKRREMRKLELDPMMVHRLAEHDTENYVGVVQHRKVEQPNALGFSCWWVTMDHMAFSLTEKLKDRLQDAVPASPVMSPDFLASYLSIGPMRAALGKDVEAQFPVSIDAGLIQYLTPELITLADKVREESKTDPEYLIRRKVRDSIDAARRRIGPIADQGLKTLLDEE